MAAETTAVAVTGGSALALAWASGLDTPALMGSFSGAMIYVMLASELSVPARLGLFAASWAFGYHSPQPVASLTGFDQPFLSSALGGLLAVTLASSVSEYFKTGQAPAWLSFIRRGK